MPLRTLRSRISPRRCTPPPASWPVASAADADLDPDCSLADSGSVTAFVALLLVALVALAGLVVDGGAAISAHQAAVDEAEQAARAGAGALSVEALRSGSLLIDQEAAIRAADAFMSAAGHPGTALVSAGGAVSVSIRYRIPTEVLGVVGITSLSVSATASAIDVRGVTVGSP
jgi:Putative Flp pilus-assembly TadE/G-like